MFGVLGDPVDHSLSPAMQNAAFAAAGLPHVYLRYRVPVRELRAAVREARTLCAGGLNLTIPLKEAVLPLCDALSPAAARMGAVNTLLFGPGGRVVGDNTDGRGFVRAVGAHVALTGAAVVLIGAGGSARAVATALADAGVARITIANRTPARAATLVERLATPAGTAVDAVPLAALARGDVLAGAALVVNATSLGLGGRRLPVRWGATPRTCLAVDLVYGPRPTPFLRDAARRGRRTLDGAAMLLHQGALAFEAWTGRRAPHAAMAAALRAAGLHPERPR